MKTQSTYMGRQILLSIGVLLLLFCRTQAATLFTDDFTGITNPNDASWYFRNGNSAGTAWVTGTDSTSPLSGNTMVNPMGTSTWSCAFKQFSKFTLNNPGDSITVQLHFHSRSVTSGVWEVAFLNTANTTTSNSFGGVDPRVDAAGYSFYHALSSTASSPQYAIITGDSFSQYSTKLSTASQTFSEADNLGHTLIFTLTETGTGVQLSSSIDGTAIDSFIASTGTIYRDFNAVRILAGTGQAFNFDDITVSTVLGYAYTGTPIYNVTWPSPPTYSSTEQAIYNVSGNTSPGQSALVSGAFSTTRKTVRLASLAGASNAATAVASSTTTVQGSLIGTTGLSFTLPTTFNTGAFAFRIEDTDGTSLVGTGNIPTIYWAQGIATSITPTTAPLHQVLVSAVEAGNTLRLFGKNFPPVSKIILTATSGATTTLTATTTNPYALTVSIPANQATGAYTVKVGSSATIDATYGATLPITINAASTLVAYQDTVTGLVGDGVTDNLSALQSFIDSHLPAVGEVEYIQIGTSGTYAISSTITLHQGQYLTGVEGVTVLGTPSSTPPETWITGSSYFGLMNLTVIAPVQKRLFATDDTNGGHVVLNHVTLTATGGTAGWPGADVYLQGPDIQVVNCTINGGTGMPFVLGANGALVTQTAITNGSYGWNAFVNSKNVIFENSSITGVDPEASSGVSYWQASILGATDGFGSCNIYTGGVSVDSIQGNNREAFTTDGGGGAYAGLLETSASGSMKLANDPRWSYSVYPPSTPSIISILAGKGVGQYRFIQSAHGRYITLTQPWDVTPDTQSVVSITNVQRHLIFYGNTVTDAGTIELCGIGQDCVIANNDLQNAAGVTIIGSAYLNGWLSNLNTEVTNNVMVGDAPPENSDGVLQTTYVNNVHVYNRKLVSGVLIRGNICSSPGVVSETFGGLNNLMGLAEFNSPGKTDGAAAAAGILLKQNELVSGASVYYVPANASAWAGLQFTPASGGLTVTHLGRMVVPGNSNTHQIRLIDPSTWMTVATTTVNLSGQTTGSFIYASLSTPVKLTANKSYYLQSQELAGGDNFWALSGVRVQPGNGVSLNSAAYDTTVAGLPGDDYGPASLLFVQEIPAIGGMFSSGTVQNNVTQWGGFKFTVGNKPMTVTQLGRWVISGNSQSHTVKLVNASTGVDVSGGSTTVTTAGVTPGQFAYADLAAPVTLEANTSYYLESQEISGGDSFYDAPGTILVPNGNITIDSSVYGTTETNSENHAYGPVNLISTY